MTQWRCSDEDVKAKEILKVSLGRRLEVLLPVRKQMVESGAELV